MSLRGDLADAFMGVPEVKGVRINDDVYHGEAAVVVTVTLTDGRTVTGTYTTEPKEGFGGVEFSRRKDIPTLMVGKVASVLAGTAEGTR